jgi:hypothetical protein
LAGTNSLRNLLEHFSAISWLGLGFQRTPLGGFVLDALTVPHTCWVKTVHFKKYCVLNFSGRRSDSKMADGLIQNQDGLLQTRKTVYFR